jgi:glyoxylase-like metal-dependent hydrolase (beta-lactamase superfamily II)
MRIRAIRTGSVRIKQSQVRGRGRGVLRRLRVFADPQWTGWLPTYAWMIDHPEGVIVVDTGQGTHVLDMARSRHPYLRWEVMFRIEPHEEVGPQLRALGVGPRDVTRVVLTHLHIDHDGGLTHFPNSDILVSRLELASAQGVMGRLRGYLPNRWPTWFNPLPLDFTAESFGPFGASTRLTKAGDVIAVSTPGHTAGHLSVIALDEGIAYVIAGDTSYTEALMLAGQVDGVSADEATAQATLTSLQRFAAERPVVYLPTHDPESAERLSQRRLAVTPSSLEAPPASAVGRNEIGGNQRVP